MAEFAHIQHGCLPSGTETAYGVIDQVSASAYLIGGTWYHYTKLHGPWKPVQPLWDTMRYKLAEVI